MTREEIEREVLNANERHGNINEIDRVKIELMMDIRDLLITLTTRIK